jgi:hypothetical protein
VKRPAITVLASRPDFCPVCVGDRTVSAQSVGDPETATVDCPLCEAAVRMPAVYLPWRDETPTGGAR